jgi:hypothetical protein
MAEAFAEGDLRGEAEVTGQGFCISIGGGDITRLHGDKLLVGLEVEILGQNPRTHQLLLEDLYEIEEVLGLTATYIIYGIGRNGQAILALFALRGALHHAYDTLDNIIDIGEVASAVAIVEDLDGFSLQELIGEAKVGHIGTTGRTIDRKETQACGGDIVEFRVAMRKELVALLGGSIEGYRIIHTVVHREGDLFVATIDGGG